MKKSIFATRLKIAMRNKDEYYIYNGKKKLKKKYIQEDLAAELDYGVDTIKSWTKSGGHIPPLDTVKRVADILNVDAVYLLGEQVCQRNADQTICNVTKLNEKSAQVLSNLSDITADIMNELLNNENLERLLLTIFEYTHSHNDVVKIINTLDGSENPSYSGNAQRQVMKYRASETFGNILDDMYNSRKKEMADIKAYSILRKMIEHIDECKPLLKGHEELAQKLQNVISLDQKAIKALVPDHLICKFTPEQIIEHFDKIKETYY